MPVLFTLSLCGRMTLNLHNLNNEGTEGNQQLTRMVNVVARQNGKDSIQAVNAVSGDMFKHIQAGHLHRLALELNAKHAGQFPLSGGARLFDANRVNSRDDAAFRTQQEGASNEALLDAILRYCAVTDLEGTLVTAGNKSLPRKSCIEFGWVVGVPELTRSDSLFHVKYDPGRAEAAGTDQVLGQAIFHRPVNSGVYAAISHVELYRVGRNDISLRYAVNTGSRLLRARALLESLWYTFVQTTGAQRNTQLPHVLAFQGAVALSFSPAVPAPTASPLQDDFVKELEGAAAALNRLHPGAIATHRFADQTEFGNRMADVIESLDVPPENASV